MLRFWRTAFKHCAQTLLERTSKANTGRFFACSPLSKSSLAIESGLVGRLAVCGRVKSYALQHKSGVPSRRFSLPRRRQLSAAASGVPVVYHEAYSGPVLPEGHRFPMGVFKRIHDMLLEDGVIIQSQIHRPSQPPDIETLRLVHDKAYLQSFLDGNLGEKEKKRIGFGSVTSTKPLITRTLFEVAGTLLTARLALEYGLACNTAGGTHHAFPAFGSGFCILNDLAVTAKALLREEAVKKVVILDLDVHQGDGTAVALKYEPQAFTVSVHCQSNFPSRKQESDLDIGLDDGLGDDEYLRIVGKMLNEILSQERPDLVLYDAGVDPHTDDSLGRLCLSDEGLFRREMLVLDACLVRGIPVAGYVGGGYSPDIGILASRHILLHKAATEMWVDHSLAKY